MHPTTMNGHNHHTYDGDASKRPPEPEDRQCGWCLVRMTGPLAGWKAARLLPYYSHWICAACQYEWAEMSDDERKAWVRERKQRDAQQQQQQHKGR